MTNDTDFFTALSPEEGEAVKAHPKRANGTWKPVFDALGAGQVLRVRVPIHQVGAISRNLGQIYPTKRLASRKTDDPAFRYLWLVDR